MLIRNFLLLVGDSITEYSFDVSTRGFGAQLENAYCHNFDVINRGFSAWTTVGIHNIIDEILEPFPKVGMATLFLGTNDACTNENFNVPLPKYKELLTIISRKIMKTTSNLVIITPCYVDDDSGWERTNDIVIDYRNTAIDVAKGLNATYLDTWNLFTGRQITDAKEIQKEDLKFFVDGLHFNKRGNNRLFEGLSTLIDATWPERKSSDVKRLSPVNAASSKL